MPEFTASLLREKFTIRDALPEDAKGREPVLAFSNRLVVPLHSADGKSVEIFVVRAQNMPLCARMAAQIAREFQENGPLLPRLPQIDWDASYRALVKGYEATFNPNHWIAIYNRGHIVYQSGAVDHHRFLDVIEQCDARNKQGYDKSLEIARDAFRQAGRLVTISYDSNVAMLMNITDKEGKCGLIVRNPGKTTTFNIVVHAAPDKPVRPSQFLSAAAAFLEAIQLAFTVGTTRQKIALELVSPASPEAVQADKAGQRLGRLRQAITEFETAQDVSYRPERPDFTAMVDDPPN